MSAIEIEGWENVETVEPPITGGESSASGDYCTVCGVPLVYGGRGKHPKYCSEHKTGSTTRSSASSSKKGGASVTEWKDFALITMLAVTYLIGRFIAGGSGLLLKPPQGIPEETFDTATRYYAMSKEEATPIAQLIARKITPTAFNKKFGKHIVSVLEYEEVGYALWSYGERVGPALVARMNAKAPAQKVAKPRKPTVVVQPTIPHPVEEPHTNGTTQHPTNSEVVRTFLAQRPTPEAPENS